MRNNKKKAMRKLKINKKKVMKIKKIVKKKIQFKKTIFILEINLTSIKSQNNIKIKKKINLTAKNLFL
jgi:hypothetical protein